MTPQIDGYKPDATTNSMAYVAPGSPGCGKARRVMYPTAATTKGKIMNVERFLYLSEAIATTTVEMRATV